jgi:predicted lactoylglutathione lyase
MEKNMASKIFVNLPVKDLDRSTAFFEKLGYSFNPKFTDASAACMVISDDIYAMLLTEAKFKEFTTKPIGKCHRCY